MTKEKFIEKVRYYLSDEFLDEEIKWQRVRTAGS